MTTRMNRKVARALIPAVTVAVFIGLLAAAAGCGSGGAVADEPTATGTVDLSFTWSADADCASCHQTEQDSTQAAAMIASVHNANGVTCLDCHSDDQQLADAHEGVTAASKMPIRLRLTSISEDTCLGCHESNHTDPVALAALTTGSTALTDSKGTVVNPHALPENSDHAIITCVSCHSMHTSVPTGQTAKERCLDCHHEDVFECGTCHEL